MLLDGRRLPLIHAEADRVDHCRINFTASTLEKAQLGAGTVGMGCRLRHLRDLHAHGMRTRGQSYSPRRPGLCAVCLLRPRSPPPLASA